MTLSASLLSGVKPSQRRILIRHNAGTRSAVAACGRVILRRPYQLSSAASPPSASGLSRQLSDLTATYTAPPFPSTHPSRKFAPRHIRPRTRITAQPGRPIPGLRISSPARPFSTSTSAMAAAKIDGTAIAKKIRERLQAQILERQRANPLFKPSLKIVQGWCHMGTCRRAKSRIRSWG